MVVSLIRLNISLFICNLSFNLASSQTYGTAVNASCGCNGETGFVLYRNGTDVTSTENNALVVLAAGEYLYNCTVPETQNYTYAQNISSYTIVPANHIVHLAINGSEVNRSYIYPSSINVTGWLEINQSISNAVLYRNGTSVATGSPAEQIIVLGAGYYNYTYYYNTLFNI